MAVIASVEAFPVLLPTLREFATSRGVVGSQAGAPHVFVQVRGSDGATGWGECRPSHRWSDETLESVVTTIRQYLGPALAGQGADDLETLGVLMDRAIAPGLTRGQPIAKAGLEMALQDLSARRLGISLSERWQGPSVPQVRLSFLITTRDPEEAGKLAAAARTEGYTGLDVKIGLDPGRDSEILRAVRAAAPGLFLRVDANQAYQLPAALRVARELERLGADVFEQPLPAAALSDLARLRSLTDLPIALDESVWTPANLIEAIRMQAADYLVVKVTKMGGLGPARLCGQIARAAGWGLLGGGLTDSHLTLAASAQLFGNLGIALPVDLNGPFFLADQVASGPKVGPGGLVELPQGPGHGCSVDLEKLAKYRAPGW